MIETTIAPFRGRELSAYGHRAACGHFGDRVVDQIKEGRIEASLVCHNQREQLQILGKQSDMFFLGKNPQRAKHIADDAGYFACGKIKRGAEFFDRIRDFRDAIVNAVRVVLEHGESLHRRVRDSPSPV